MFYYLYQITNKVNNKIYVGVHKTKSLDDGYMGSGSIIRNAIVKHGVSNFEKVILEYFGTQSAMYAKEKEVVDEEFLERDDVYNLRCGGYGGFDYINKTVDRTNRKYLDACSRGGSKSGKFNIRNCNSTESIGSRVFTRKSSGRYNVSSVQLNSTDSIVKRSQTMRDKGHQKEGKNSQYGTMWITNGIESLKIKKTDLIPNGYVKGRKQKRKIASMA